LIGLLSASRPVYAGFAGKKETRACTGFQRELRIACIPFYPIAMRMPEKIPVAFVFFLIFYICARTAIHQDFTQRYFLMSARAYLSLSLLIGMLAGSISHCSAQGLSLYTAFTKILVPPGESLDYPIDVINKSSGVRAADISVTGLPKEWTWQLKSGNWNVEQVSVLPGEKKNLYLQLQVPLRVNKGAYHFRLLAGGQAQLPLTVVVSEQGTFKTELSSPQANMEGAANTTFTFSAKLRNSTAGNEVYALKALAPPGWGVAFKANYKQVSSVSVDANHTQDLTISLDPPDETPAGTYKIPVIASAGANTANLVLEVHITGSYAVELTTPTGLLSTTITAGDEKPMALVLKNTGSTELSDISFRSATPVNWAVSFEPQRIERLAPGETAQVVATIKADRNAIAGDYVTRLEASSPGASSKAEFRVSVRTPLLWSWSGILIIAASAGSVYYLFRKYGRR
jgi:uncharacterized membrane protein